MMGCAATASLSAHAWSYCGLRREGPQIIGPSPQNEANPVRLGDGRLRIYFMERNGHVASITSQDNGLTWTTPNIEFKVSGDTGYACRSMVDRNGRVHLWYVQRGDHHPNLPAKRYLDIWYNHTDDQHRWQTSRLIWNGYCGALRDAIELDNGRILVPFGSWKKGDESLPENTGDNYTILIFSDDGGKTWTQPSVALTSPVYEGYNGNNYGACEPCITKLQDGKLWMLIRTQTGYLYESYSENGIEWSPAQPSRFATSNSPAAFVNLPDSRVVVLWNNHQLPPRVDGQGVYGGRDALHAAITNDGGRTWRGFREVYLDPTRNDTPPRSGDRGTAYPNGEVTADGYILLTTGQGEHARALIRFHPDWLYETRRQHNFTHDGLESWSVYKSFGEAQRWWRDRKLGAQLHDHPGKRGAKVLHIRRADQDAADGATWNFPAGRKGKIEIHIRVNKGFQGAQISLADRLFDPTDDQGEKLAVFKLQVRPDGTLEGDARFVIDKWQTLEIKWDVTANGCEITIDNRDRVKVPMHNETVNGISYLRLRSLSAETDHAGIFVERVAAEISS